MSDNLSFLSNSNPEFVENLYKDYQADPASVDPSWKRFFDGFEFAQHNYSNGSSNGHAGSDVLGSKELAVLNLINAYRTRGHLFTKTNPVRDRRKYSPTLELKNFGLEASDLESVFQAGKDVGFSGPTKLKDIVALLEQTYCQSIGAEYRYIRHPERI
ncbi:MAG: 2-oxoglutarate dehydrogenase E1 component, partial [Bacteroidota bacterium]